MVTRPAMPFFFAFIVVMGMCGITAQTVLARELLIIFSGNELSIGIMIGNWILWGAIGSYLGGRIVGNGGPPDRIAPAALLLSSCLFPAAIYTVRLFKELAVIPTEVGTGIPTIFSASLLLLMPTSLLHGVAFGVACSFGDGASPRASPAGTVYSLDALGTLTGGVLVTFLLVPFTNSFQIAVLAAAVGGGACLLFSHARQPGRPTLLKGLSALVTAAALLALAAGFGERLHIHSTARQWPGKTVLSYTNSPYQNIVVTETEEQYTFYTDGLPSIVSPVPDIAFVEEFVHFAMTAHGRPERVLVLHGGAGGIITELLKYPSVKAIDYVETDPDLLKAVLRYSDRLTKRELSDGRVTLHFQDPRLFVRNSGAVYDIVLLGLSRPRTLQANRLFTREFFRSLGKSMKENGVFTLTVPGSRSYYAEELRDLNASIIATLRDVFPSVHVIAGDTNILLAFPSERAPSPSPAVMLGRLRSAGVETALISLPHLMHRLDNAHQQWFQSQVAGSLARVNGDMLPSALFYSISYESLLFSPALRGLFIAARGISLQDTLLFCAAFCLFSVLLAGRNTTRAVSFSVAGTGFSAMVLEVILLFGFQVFQGYVFYAIGILVAVFMAGLAAGSFTGSRLVRGEAAPGRFFLACEALLTALALALAPVLLLPFLPGTILNAAIGFLLFLTGFVTGCEFPLAAACYGSGRDLRRTSRPMAGAAGTIYALDLFGGWLGGLLGAFLLFPVLGVYGSCIVVVAVKGATILPLALSLRR